MIEPLTPAERAALMERHVRSAATRRPHDVHYCSLDQQSWPCVTARYEATLRAVEDERDAALWSRDETLRLAAERDTFTRAERDAANEDAERLTGDVRAVAASLLRLELTCEQGHRKGEHGHLHAVDVLTYGSRLAQALAAHRSRSEGKP